MDGRRAAPRASEDAVVGAVDERLRRTTTCWPAPNWRHSTCADGSVLVVKSWKATPSIRMLRGTGAPSVGGADLRVDRVGRARPMPPRIRMSDALSTKNQRTWLSRSVSRPRQRRRTSRSSSARAARGPGVDGRRPVARVPPTRADDDRSLPVGVRRPADALLGIAAGARAGSSPPACARSSAR